MCGIVGIVDQLNGVPVSLINEMKDSLIHRGPDGGGTYIDRRGIAGLGHRRLAILDLSTNGQQPMSTPDGRYTIVFNGEIYNYIELKEELEKKGFTFSTSSDTEVLLKGYEEWGQNVLDKLIGMFAFAVWDRDKEELFLARDRVGKKPLLYFWDGHVFAFGSELKAFRCLHFFEAKLDPEAVEAYLALGYIPAPLSIFQNVRKLLPGHFMTFSKGILNISRFWYPEKTQIRPANNREERIEECRLLLQNALRLRLRSDVPIGIFLSGGIDSAIVALESVNQGLKPHAFTLTFDHDQTDLPYAEQVAKFLGIDQEVIYVSGKQAQDDIFRITWQYDEPFADTSNIPSYYIASAAGKRVKVVLNGDGGDEVFGGYRHYERIALKQSLKLLMCALRLKDGSINNCWQTYFQSKSTFRRTERDCLLVSRKSKEDSFSELLESNPYLKALKPKDFLHMALWADRSIYLPDDLLYKMDIALMAHGVEGRSPLLDQNLLEWAQGLPLSDLVAGQSKKILLREIYSGVLPSSILDRPKHGFGSPVNQWLRGSFQKIINEYLPSPLFDFKFQETLLKIFQRKNREFESNRVWRILIFSLWAKQWKATW